jgi:hypothetical protein
MQPVICSRCKKNVAVVFITKIENGKTVNEGLCLKCAKELNIKPVKELMQNMGISDDELDGISEDMLEAFNGSENLAETEGDEENGKTATSPFSTSFSEAPLTSPPKPAETESERARSRANRPSSAARTKGNSLKITACLSRPKPERASSTGLSAARRRPKGSSRFSTAGRRTTLPHRRARRGQDGDCRGPRPAHSKRRGPYKLRDKEVYLLDLTSLVAGTQFRGQFESRMKGLIDEIKKQGNIILVIDEVHSIVGAGDAEGSMNAANILKPALSRGEIQVIGATTFAEYRKHIEKDSALERRFQPVTVAEPSVEESIEILKGIAHYYEEFHNVVIPDEMCRQAVLLSERYITDRFLPDKAIDLIDEACSDVNLKSPVLRAAPSCIRSLAIWPGTGNDTRLGLRLEQRLPAPCRHPQQGAPA